MGQRLMSYLHNMTRLTTRSTGGALLSRLSTRPLLLRSSINNVRQQLRLLSSNINSNNSSSSGTPYQSYEYPWATEPPVVTRTTALDAVKAAVDKTDATDEEVQATTKMSVDEHERQPTKKSSSWFGGIFSSKESISAAESTTADSSSASISKSSSSSSNNSNSNSNAGFLSTISSAIVRAATRNNSSDDPFDDSGALSPQEIEALRLQQRQTLPTALPTLEPVTKSVPSYIPPNVPATELATPETVVTLLSNGIRVVSQETYGQVSTVGAVSQLGSRHESARNNTTGITNLLELTSFGACGERYDSASAVAHQLQDWGGSRFVSTGREQSIHCIDLLRPGVANAVAMLADVLLRPHFLPQELEEAKQAIQFQSLPDHMPPELLLSEALQAAAYGTDQQLGQPHFCPVDALPGLNRDIAKSFWQTQVVQNPSGLVIGGAGVQHDQLVQLAELHFGHLRQQDDAGRIATIPSVYRGGEGRVQLPVPDANNNNNDGSENAASAAVSVVSAEQRLTRVAVALEVGGWHSDSLVATCVLQTLLGGGSSFSAGGPGKGMYSRLYRQVLNKFRWAESAEAFTAFHTESGLFGISGSTQAVHAPAMVQTFCLHLARLAVEPVAEIELVRARNMLKNNVLTQLESRLVLFEDMARQVLTYGKREDIRETCRKIDAVTAADLQAVIVEAMQKPPTVAAVGVDVQQVPTHEQVSEWLHR